MHEAKLGRQMTLGCPPKTVEGISQTIYRTREDETLPHRRFEYMFRGCRTHVGRDARHVVPGRHVAAGRGDVRRPDRGRASEAVRASTSRRQPGAARQGPTAR